MNSSIKCNPPKLPPKPKQIDNIKHPAHYTNGRFETIEIIQDITGEAFEGFLLGNIIKYLARYKYKNGVEDLKKARWYLDRLIQEQEGEGSDGEQKGES